MVILVSACILGDPCRYDGKDNYNEAVARCMQGHKVIKICPEVLSGMPVPRKCVELVDGIPTDCDGTDVCLDYQFAADLAMGIVEEKRIDLAILQSRSPMCGVNSIYDGSFSGRLIDEPGIFAEELLWEGYRVMDVEDFREEDFRAGIYRCRDYFDEDVEEEDMDWKNSF